MKLIASALVAALVATLAASCGNKPAMVARVQSYTSDARPADADECASHGKDAASDNAADAKPSEPIKPTPSPTPSPVPTPTPTPPVGEVVTTPIPPKVEIPEPIKPVDPVVPADPKLEKIKAMLAEKRLMSTYDVTNAQAWGTTKDSRIELLVAVDNNGKALVPRGLASPEAKGNVDASMDAKFPTTELHSVFKVCNKSAVDIRLHAQPNLPFDHGATNIRKGACMLYLLSNANSVPDGKSWDHIIGEKVPVLFNVVKIKPDGSVFK